MSLRKLFYSLTPSLRLWVRKLVFMPVDLLKKEYYENGIPVPPKSITFTGGGNFKETGFKFLSFFQKYGNLQSNHNVLDIGSGIGRMAIPLTHYIDSSGSYEGFDIMDIGIKWCRNNVTSKFQNFKFTLLNFKNDLYKNSGQTATDFCLDFPSEYFDFAFLISVFTHMLPNEVDHYVGEISRTLKKDASCLITLFAYEDERLLAKNAFDTFHKQDDQHALMDLKVKSANVAYSYDYFQNILLKHQLHITYFSKGGWRGLNNPEDFQDFIVVQKK